jgi:hypothetical protein
MISMVFATGILFAGAATAAPPGLTTFTENFENGNNTGGWTFGNAADAIEPSGGNPGSFLRNDSLDTIGPRARTGDGVTSVFTGDYRARAVTAAGIDLSILRVDTTSQGRPVTLMLYSDADTPEDATDDCTVYFIGGKPAPPANGHWARYRFRIASDSLTLPNRWQVSSCAGRSDDAAWNLTISDVDRLSYYMADPELFYIFQMWDVGIDNPTISYGTPDPAVAD